MKGRILDFQLVIKAVLMEVSKAFRHKSFYKSAYTAGVGLARDLPYIVTGKFSTEGAFLISILAFSDFQLL